MVTVMVSSELALGL